MKWNIETEYHPEMEKVLFEILRDHKNELDKL